MNGPEFWRLVGTRLPLFFLLFWAAWVSAREDASRTAILCPGISITGELSPALSETERLLVCGDPRGPEPYRSAWKRVPHSQATFHLKNFLQERGFHQPVFDTSSNGNLHVELGSPTVITALHIEGAPDPLDFERKRDILGRPLTPKLLDEVETWTKQRLSAIGYPCAKTEVAADPLSGELSLRIQPGEPKIFGSIEEEPIPGVLPGIMRRHDAFPPGSLFNGDFLQLSAQRIMNEGTLLSAHFATTCSPEGTLRIRQESVPGLPHVLTIGFGADTEGLLSVRVSWRNTRLGSTASLFDVSARASAKEQQLLSSLQWYYRDHPSRFYLYPAISIRHQNEEPYQILSSEVQVSPSYNWDAETLGGSIRLGPAWEGVRTLRGAGPSTARFLSLTGEFRALSHYFELYRTDPRSGFFSVAGATFNDRRIYSSVTAQRLRWTGQALWNLQDYEPHLVIIGLRWGFYTTVTGESLDPSGPLPPDFRYFLGGSTDLRGFGRKEIPRTQQGGLTSGFLGVEVRLAKSLPLTMEPLFFLDAGALGGSPFVLDAPVFLSPGAGLRWHSPIGTLRTTLARGIAANDVVPPQWQFYLSFGEEF